MVEVKKLFENIGRSDIDENMQNLVEDGIIDSMDIMALITEIENTYQTNLDFDMITPENFSSFKSIDVMIKSIKENS